MLLYKEEIFIGKDGLKIEESKSFAVMMASVQLFFFWRKLMWRNEYESLADQWESEEEWEYA